MISSTALDLPEHRAGVREACLDEGFFPIGMEHLPARDASGIRVSLEMVDQADIYIGIYAWRYGWVPDFDNPGQISITEMEFARAVERKQRGELKEILVFVMHEQHPIVAADKEDGEEPQKKLAAFKQRAAAGRVTARFQSKEELRRLVAQALADLKQRCALPGPNEPPVISAARGGAIPRPPAFYAEPDYIGSHEFVGRDSQLLELSDWAARADPTNLLLFEAIGGNGKSMLTWEWMTRHATRVRDDWAGRFWYSFYEHGAVTTDFCHRALAYMTGAPLEDLWKVKLPELKDRLIRELHARPWLLVLDGLERVLVAYHRIDAAEVPDEEANQPTDKMANRDPCDAIREEDNDLLRALAGAAPSKIVVTSRLTPRVLLNPSGQPIVGVKRIHLPGLRPPDAEKLLRACGISGDSAAIQSYLTANCDNHPLVIGVLAGLINDYLPDKGNFDAWAADPDGGEQLNLASLNLVRRRNHILRTAVDALPEKSRELLSTLSLLSAAVDYETLAAVNPHLPGDPEEAGRLAPPQLRVAAGELAKTVRDLERRGLIQYDRGSKRYDLHPVVRGIAGGGLAAPETERYGLRVVDYFSRQHHAPYENAETLDDLRVGLNLVRVLIRMGRLEQAYSAFVSGGLAAALQSNLDARAEVLNLLRPYFPHGWTSLPVGVAGGDVANLANTASGALYRLGEYGASLPLIEAALLADLKDARWEGVIVRLGNISYVLEAQNRLARQEECVVLSLDLALLNPLKIDHFRSRLDRFAQLSLIGKWAAAEEIWLELDAMGRMWPQQEYRPGRAEFKYALFHFWKGTLTEEHLTAAEELARKAKNRVDIRNVHGLRGEWRLEQADWGPAAASYSEAVRLARESGIRDMDDETALALARFHLGQLADAPREAERLGDARLPAHRQLARLWLAIGDRERAAKHAMAAYREAWADGEPYVRRYRVDQAAALLQQLNRPIPNLPPYDPAKDKKLGWEEKVVEAIETLRRQRSDSKSLR